jgi:hypothetical protein
MLNHDAISALCAMTQYVKTNYGHDLGTNMIFVRVRDGDSESENGLHYQLTAYRYCRIYSLLAFEECCYAHSQSIAIVQGPN